MNVPIQESLANELTAFWKDVFGGSDLSRDELLGSEYRYNAVRIYINRSDDDLAGTCTLTVSNKIPSLGGLGEVATKHRFRRLGIATRLCAQAVEEFRIGGGEALFLGTGNPEAARVYRRLGWTKLAGANVMVNVTNGSSEEFLVKHFRTCAKPIVKTGSPEFHLPMIPLILTPNNWQVLDSNLDLFSTRYRVQNSCMGLYPKYRALSAEGRGAWFGAMTSDGRAVGLSSVSMDREGGYSVDGFAHGSYLDVWPNLIQKALDWGRSHASGQCWANVSVEDEEKMSLFKKLEFRALGTFELERHQGAQIETASEPNGLANYVRMELQ